MVPGERGLTWRAVDGGDSAAFSSTFLASGFSCSQAESTPTCQKRKPLGAQNRNKEFVEIMPELITLTCPSCGGKLQITSDMDRFACGNCGNEHVVMRRGGTVFLAPVIETLHNIREGTDKTASELAIARLRIEIEEIEKFKKGIVDAISAAFNDPIKFRDVKKILASRRKSFFDRIAFQSEDFANACVRDIQNMSPEEFAHLKSNITVSMICINLETLANLEKKLQEKRNQLSQHQKVVNG